MNDKGYNDKTRESNNDIILLWISYSMCTNAILNFSYDTYFHFQHSTQISETTFQTQIKL